MNKFEWVAEKSLLADTMELRWTVFMNAGSRVLSQLFNKNMKVLSSSFEKPIPSDNEVKSMRRTIQCFSDSNVSSILIAWALAKHSYTEEEIYDDLWKICVDLSKRGTKLLKRGLKAPNLDHVTTDSIIIKTLSVTLAMTKITTTSLEQADKLYNEEIEPQKPKGGINKQPINIFNEDINPKGEDDEGALVYIILIQAYINVRAYVADYYKGQLIEEITQERVELSKLNRISLKQIKSKDLIIEEKSQIINELVSKDLELKLSSPKLCVSPCDNMVQKDNTAVIDRLEVELASKEVKLETCQLDNEDLKDQLQYYSVVQELTTKDYDEYNNVESDDVINKTIHDVLRGYRLVIYGGHQRWRISIKAYLDQNKLSYDFGTSFSVKPRSNDIIMYNVCGMSHTDYWNYCSKTTSNTQKTHLVFLRGLGGFKGSVIDIMTHE